MATRRAFLALVLALAASCSKFQTYGGPPVTSIVVHKADRRMYLLNGNTVLRDYRIALGGNPVGPKQFEGDQRTPEGAYVITHRNPNSQYHLSLGISYPTPVQVDYAISQGKKAGGDIFIHGRAGKNRGKGRDWTVGCIAVTDHEMEQIYAMVRVGTPIFILP
jgi:murein L,D-transpeptidase YafK